MAHWMEVAVISLLIFGSQMVLGAKTEKPDEIGTPRIVEESTFPTLGPDIDRITTVSVVEGSNLSTPIATSAETFMDLIKNGNMFVDKTYMIREILHERFDLYSHIKIFARPNGWGKSVYLDMIKTYCEPTISNKTRFLVYPNRTEKYRFFKYGEVKVNGVMKKLREPLLISRDTQTEVHLGQHPVVFMKFGGLRPKSFDEFKSGVAARIRESFKIFDFHHIAAVLGSETDRVDVLCDSIESGKYDWESLTYLSNTIKQFFNLQTMILIDDYDEPLMHVLNEPNVSNKKETVKKIMNFYRVFFDHMGKHRSAYFRLILAGTMRMVFDNSILARDTYDELEGAYQLRLGFTENEVNMIFDEVDLKMLQRIQAKIYCGGYRMSAPEPKTFVPSAIAKFVAARKIGEYWTPSEALDGVFDRFLRDIPFYRRDITELCKMPRDEDPANACTAMRGDFIDDDKMEDLCDFLDGRVEITNDNYQLYRVMDFAQYVFSSSGHLTRWSQIPNEGVRAFIKKKLGIDR